MISILNVNGQSKTVKIKSESIYVSFFYKSFRPSRHTKNDSLFYLTKRITDSTFTLEKVIKKRKAWLKKIYAMPARDSLNIYDKVRDSKGNSKIIKSKALYYVGIEMNAYGTCTIH